MDKKSFFHAAAAFLFSPAFFRRPFQNPADLIKRTFHCQQPPIQTSHFIYFFPQLL